jgi:hypothetical protein
MTLTRNAERRKHRRHDLSDQDLPVYAVVSGSPADTARGTLLDISSGGIKFATQSSAIHPTSRISVQLTLPSFAGIKPFIGKFDEQPTTNWQGEMQVTRVDRRDDGSYEIAGRLMEMSDGERGLLGLYLSTQPLAA